jgi:putative FmdB family regulatory protein
VQNRKRSEADLDEHVKSQERIIMPIYEYHCQKCNQDFEYLVFGSDEPNACPACGGKKVNRLMSACGFKSKGSGGETVRSSASSSSCGSCSATSCAGCGS